MSNVATIPPAQAIRAELYSPHMTEEFGRVMPDAKALERFKRTAWSTISRNPDLLNSDRRSLFSSIMDAAQLGLVVDGFLGEGYLVTFKGKVQFLPGYRGLLKLARQSGEISSIDVDTIHENDKVTLRSGDVSQFSIETNWQDRGEIIGAYAICHFKDGGIQRAIMSLAEIEKIRKAAFSGNSPAWRNSYGEMAKKTCFRRLAKMLPLSTEAQKALGLEDAVDEGKTARVDGDAIVTEDSPQDTPPPRQRRSRLDALAEAAPVDVESEPVEQDDVPPPTGEQDIM